MPCEDTSYLIKQVSKMQDKQQKQHDLETSELRYRRLFETAQDGILILNGESGKISDVNPFLLNLLKYTKDELVGKNLWEIGAFKDITASKEAFAALQKKEYVRYEDLPLEAKDGQLKQVEFISNVYTVVDEKIIQCNIRDVSERKKFQAEQRLRAKMSSRLATVGEMAAGIAHEINNPLTCVIGFSELLMTEEDLPKDIRERLRIINDSSQRVKDIVKRMLTFVRQTKPMRTSININELIDNTLEIRRYVLKTGNIELIKKYKTGLPELEIDPGQMQQVFMNLIVNAEYAMKKAHGKGTLTITTENEDGYISLSFKDDGPGIEPAVLPHLFESFFTTKESGEGTGLGLSVSYGIIQEHGGSIKVESELGKGATFIIELPITLASAKPEVKVPVTTTTRPEKKANILVVDDEPTVRLLIEHIMNKNGHTVEECASGEEALEKLDNNSYDVILMDLRMPGMSGMQLYDQISNRWTDLIHRVVFITGDAYDPASKEYLATYQVPFITKPFDRKTLEEKVNAVLSTQS